MSSTKSTLVLIAAGAAFLATPAVARPRAHHHHRYAAAAPDGSGEPYGYRNAPYPQAYGGYYGPGAGGWEAAANARLTAQAYREPGLTLELAPDAKLTATGGPSGGVPGFSGH